MIKISVKVREDNKWKDVPIEKLRNVSLLNYLLDEPEPAVAAIMNDNNKADFVISNRYEFKEHYDSKGVMFYMPAEFILMFHEKIKYIPLVGNVFEGSTLFSLEALEPEGQ